MGLSTGREKLGSMANTSRMTSYQRREQLIEIGRSLFAAKGFEAVSVEEIASTAKVSKPIVYEHFGGKEGLYAVVVDREMRALTDVLINALSDPQAHPRQIVERTALALLTYVEENAEGFRVLTRDSPKTDPSNSFNSLLGDIAVRVEDILTDAFKRQHLPAKSVPYYAQMLIGMTVYTCQYWADQRKLSKEQLAAHIVNLAWYGLSRMEAKPELRYESEKAAREAEKQAAREAKAIAKQEKQGKKAAQSQENDGATTNGATTYDGTDVVITSYDLLRRDVDDYAACHFALMALDEAQYIKNHATKVAKSVKQVTADHRFALTGTPIENRLSELWSIFDFLMPGLLGTYTKFREKYEQPIMAPGPEHSVMADKLQALVGLFIKRRLKKDVLTDLPDKFENVLTVKLEG